MEGILLPQAIFQFGPISSLICIGCQRYFITMNPYITNASERQDSGYNYPPYSNQPYGASGIPVGGGYHNPAYDPCHQSPYNNPYPYNGAGYGQQYYNNQPYQRGPEYNNYGQGNYAYNNSNGTGGVEDLCACCAALCCACCLMEACLR